MPIKQNQVVTINFTLKDETGEIIDSTQGNNPFSFISGNNQILPKLEESISIMLIGSKTNVKLNPVDAYGEYKEEAVQTVDRSEFPQDVELEEGMSFMAHTPEGKQVPLTIAGVEGDKVTVDFNHPLAGRALEFDVELLNIRDATLEELQHGHVHGPDGHHHH
jgi:FKBP-type peptidyl-prolyl cis-trans isomerase SlyD